MSNPIHIEMDEPVSEDMHSESQPTGQNISADKAMDIDEPPLYAPNDPPAHSILSSSSSLTPGANTTHQPQHQSTLQLSGTLAVTRNVTAEASIQKSDHCAVCVNAYCKNRWECPGKGNRANCACPGHPPLRNGQSSDI